MTEDYAQTLARALRRYGPDSREVAELAPHWHVSYGLEGYGPDGENTMTALTLESAAELAHDELERSSDLAEECAHILAGEDTPDYAGAWREHTRSEELASLAANLSSSRASAPLYRGHAELWSAELGRQLATFPHYVSEHTRLYVWGCSELECLLSELSD